MNPVIELTNHINAALDQVALFYSQDWLFYLQLVILLVLPYASKLLKK